ncbi:hypothetical protein DPX16_17388 [Anabarilius grahami]|uniref:Uncharacterized protein n=1 Tax=Anabarilius grahami TaxID=495550 RepID=A0A3N0XYX6_ANAGA|nr:hypothetical protein DPX16_17388 [Anabarilius grahami]
MPLAPLPFGEATVVRLADMSSERAESSLCKAMRFLLISKQRMVSASNKPDNYFYYYFLRILRSDPDSNIVWPRSGPRLVYVDYMQTRCGPDLGRHYAAVRGRCKLPLKTCTI